MLMLKIELLIFRCECYKMTSCLFLISSLLDVCVIWATLSVQKEQHWLSNSSKSYSAASQETITQNQEVKTQIQKRGNECQLYWKNEKWASHLTVLHTNAFQLKCPVTGKPKPAIKWLKNGEKIVTTQNGKVQARGYSLELKEAYSPFDEGNYTCIVENDCGSLHRDFFVKVIVRYLKKPVFDGLLQNHTVAQGTNITLICRTLSDAPHVVYWLKISKNVSNNSFYYLKTGDNKFVNGTHLIIFNANTSDSGQYMCYSANEFGSNNRTVWISVIDDSLSGNTQYYLKTNETLKYILSATEIEATQNTSTGKEDFGKGNVMFYLPITLILGFFLVCILLFVLYWYCPSIGHHKTTERYPVVPTAKQWEISRENLKLFEQVGEGEFGIVYRGQITGTPDICGYLNQTVVAVKMLKAGATMKEVQDLFTEVNTMKSLGCHPNVIQFIGCCSVKGPLAVVMEYAAYGSLKNVLRQCKKSQADDIVLPEIEDEFFPLKAIPNSFFPFISSHQLWKFSLQVAKGMEYLASRKIVHRDVAARNVLVDNNFMAKIADFGLTRDVTSSLSEQYVPGRHRCLPIKWMSPESLAEKVFTTKSDVWSFGILLWEIFTYASNPYPTVQIQNLFSLLKAGYRMEKPSAASEEMYFIMKSCWQFCAQDRPFFSELAIHLESLNKINIE